MTYTQQERDDLHDYGYLRADDEQIEPVAPKLPYTADAVQSYVSDLMEQKRFPMCPNVYREWEKEVCHWMGILRDLDRRLAA